MGGWRRRLPTAASRAGAGQATVGVVLVAALVGAGAFSSHLSRASGTGGRHARRGAGGTAGVHSNAGSMSAVPVGHGEHGACSPPHSPVFRTHSAKRNCASQPASKQASPWEAGRQGQPGARSTFRISLDGKGDGCHGFVQAEPAEAARGAASTRIIAAPYDPWIWASRSIRLYCVRLTD